jgi:transposase
VNRIICGVDVSKDWLDAHVRPVGVTGRFGNDAAGIAELAAFCGRHAVELVAMEASGGYERLAYLLLSELGQPCAPPLNARNVRRFAEAMGFLEKTDTIDAGVIAHYAEVRKVQPAAPPSPAQQRLKALVSRLSQVTGDLVANRQRRAAASSAETLDSIDEVIALLKRQQRSLAGEIASLIDDDPLWARLDAALRAVKGVAGRTVAVLMATVPEIGMISNKAVAKVVGLAPIANDSGGRQGHRPVRGGRSGPRAILFLIARIAARYDPHLKAFHDRLQKAGKPKMVIRIALARKLLVILNAKARDARNEFANAT